MLGISALGRRGYWKTPLQGQTDVSYYSSLRLGPVSHPVPIPDRMLSHVWLTHMGGAPSAVPALCPRCAKSRLFFTTGSHGSQGPELCTLQPLLAHQGFFVLV